MTCIKVEIVYNELILFRASQNNVILRCLVDVNSRNICLSLAYESTSEMIDER